MPSSHTQKIDPKKWPLKKADDQMLLVFLWNALSLGLVVVVVILLPSVSPITWNPKRNPPQALLPSTAPGISVGLKQ